MEPQDHTGLDQKGGRWLFKDLTEKIIGAAFEVHRELGAGFLEYVYEEALVYELELKKIIFKRQEEIDIYYKDKLIPKKYTPDFVIEDKVIVELKASSGLTANDEAQLLNYLKATRFRVGLLLNFGQESLEIRRRIL